MVELTKESHEVIELLRIHIIENYTTLDEAIDVIDAVLIQDEV